MAASSTFPLRLGGGGDDVGISSGIVAIPSGTGLGDGSSLPLVSVASSSGICEGEEDLVVVGGGRSPSSSFSVAAVA